MKHPDPISGIHHITAIASSAPENLAFYEQLLGLRMVKTGAHFYPTAPVSKWSSAQFQSFPNAKQTIRTQRSRTP